MKKCVIIGHVDRSKYRNDQLNRLIEYFNSRKVDVIITSSDHIEKRDGVKNYITTQNVSDGVYNTKMDQTHFTPGINKLFRMNNGYKNEKMKGENYFAKRLNITTEYVHLLGYEYVYLIESDCEIRKDYFDTITDENYNYETTLYTLGYPDFYSMAIAHGTVKEMKELFSEYRLSKLEQSILGGTTVVGIENAIHHIVEGMDQEQRSKIKVVSEDVGYMFEKYNTSSSMNTADVFFESNTNSYSFLMMKGDYMENTFSCELFCGDVSIFNHTLINTGLWFCFKLENHKEYTIKYYEGPFDEYYLSQTKIIYTNPENIDLHNNIVEDYY
jgi:hypothetical protein